MNMKVIPALPWYSLIWKLASLFQFVSCRPPGLGFLQIPNAQDGASCPRDPDYGEYCDKYGSGQIKRCSPCSLDQLNNPNINFPIECAELRCPYRCPEDISDALNQASNDSCLSTTTGAITTIDTTTDTPPTVTVNEIPTPPSTLKPVINTTLKIQSSTTLVSSGYSGWPVWKIVLVNLCVIITFVVVTCLVYLYMRKRKKNIPISSSTEPMIDENSHKMNVITHAPTATRPTMVPGQTLVTIQTAELEMYAKLACECTGDPIPLTPEGAALEGLLQSTRYEVVVGTVDGTTFIPRYQELIETTGDPPHGLCTFTLHNLKEYMEGHSQDVGELNNLFSRIERRHQGMLRALAQAVGTGSLFDDVGSDLLSEIIKIDGQLRDEEDSVRMYKIQLAIRSGTAPMPRFVSNISRKLSAIHETCIPCRHFVCQDSRNTSETAV